MGQLQIAQAGITPAWAGKSEYWLFSQVCKQDHPRVGGEKEAL